MSHSAYEDFLRSSSDSTKQLNLGWTVTSWIFTAAFLVGLFLVAILLILLAVKPEYRNGDVSRKSIIILGWVGFGLMLFGLWSTINSFYTVVRKINQDVRVKRGCSLFNPENARNAVDAIAANEAIEDNLTNIINSRRRSIVSSNTLAGDEYVMSDASSRVSLGRTAVTESRSPDLRGLTSLVPSSSDTSSSRLDSLFGRSKFSFGPSSSSSSAVIDSKEKLSKIYNILNDDKRSAFKNVLNDLKSDSIDLTQANAELRRLNIPATLSEGLSSSI
jgi:hypothetical protein